jgi:hypothetical protein
VRSKQVSKKPKCSGRSWPGLKAEDRLSRVVTRWVKEKKEEAENEAWAHEQIARLLDHVPPDTVMKLLYLEARRRREPIPPSPIFLSGRILRQMRIGITT